MTSKFAAIPTIYRGIQMRSRLEAKWASVFDAFGWHWEYEPIDLRGWIPDFVLNIAAFSKPVLVEIKPLFDYQDDRPTIIKIEQALGAPLPNELRTPNAPLSCDEWEPFFDTLKYEVILLGAKPLLWGADVFPGETVNGTLAIGWRFQRNYSWWPETELCSPEDLNEAWRRATNAVQWRAPR